MSDSFSLSAFIPASPLQVYAAWLDGDQHTEMTGGAAHSEPVVGASFDAWDGYIHGRNLELEPGRRIVQAWRSTEFPDDAPDSRIELLLEPEGEGTRVTLRHSEIPTGQAESYEKGWHEHYFTPMREYFIRRGLTRVISADQAKPAEQWERPDDKEEMDDWSSESDHDVGWEAPVVEEPAEEDEPADEAPARPITLEAERPFLEPPKPKPQPAAAKPERKRARPIKAKAARPKPKAVKGKRPAKSAGKKAPARKKAAPRKKAPAKKKTTKKATKKRAPAKKTARKPKKKSTKKVGKKPAKQRGAKKAAKKVAKRPARKPAKKAVRKPAKKKRR